MWKYRLRTESLTFPETLLKIGANWWKESFLDRKTQAKRYFEVKNYRITSKHKYCFPTVKIYWASLVKPFYGWVGSIPSAGTLVKRKGHASFSINFNAIAAVLGDGGDSPGWQLLLQVNDCIKDVLTFLYAYVTLGGGGYYYLYEQRKNNSWFPADSGKEGRGFDINLLKCWLKGQLITPILWAPSRRFEVLAFANCIKPYRLWRKYLVVSSSHLCNNLIKQ